MPRPAPLDGDEANAGGNRSAPSPAAEPQTGVGSGGQDDGAQDTALTEEQVSGYFEAYEQQQQALRAHAAAVSEDLSGTTLVPLDTAGAAAEPAPPAPHPRASITAMTNDLTDVVHAFDAREDPARTALRRALREELGDDTVPRQRVQLHTSDYYFLVMMLICALVVLVNWEEYARCEDPLQVWLVVDYMTLFCFRLLHFFSQYLRYNARASEGSGRRAHRLEWASVFVILFVVYPFLWFWSVLGAVWFRDSGRCLPGTGQYWGFLFWLAFIFLYLIIYGVAVAVGVRNLLQLRHVYIYILLITAQVCGGWGSLTIAGNAYNPVFSIFLAGGAAACSATCASSSTCASTASSSARSSRRAG